MTSSPACGSFLTSVVQSIHHHIELLIVIHIILWAVKMLNILDYLPVKNLLRVSRNQQTNSFYLIQYNVSIFVCQELSRIIGLHHENSKLELITNSY